RCERTPKERAGSRESEAEREESGRWRRSGISGGSAMERASGTALGDDTTSEIEWRVPFQLYYILLRQHFFRRAYAKAGSEVVRERIGACLAVSPYGRGEVALENRVFTERDCEIINTTNLSEIQSLLRVRAGTQRLCALASLWMIYTVLDSLNRSHDFCVMYCSESSLLGISGVRCSTRQIGDRDETIILGKRARLRMI
ncbi:hypothetical protein Tco_0929224, partial [Tanacetum coccineum]